MDSPYKRELQLALAALQAAAKISLSIISTKDKGVVEKDDLSPVTIADFAVQALLTATFKDAFPDDAFVGEESASALRENPKLLDRVWQLLQLTVSGAESSSLGFKLPVSKEHMCDLIDECGSTSPAGKESGRLWIFDPIDGTKTYVRGELYAINIGLLVDGRQTVGVVGCPNTPLNAAAPLRNEHVDPTGQGCIVFAVRGHGAFVRPMCSDATSPPRKLESQPRRLRAEDVRFVTCTTIVDSALDGVHNVVAERLGAPYPGSDLVPWVLRWAALAMGLGNTTVWVYKRRDRFAKVWDHAGAMLLFEETGGKITDVHGKDIDLTVGRKMSANFGFVAAPVDLHATVLTAVHDVLKEQGHSEFLS